MSVSSWIRRSFKNAVSVTDTLASGMGAGDMSFLFTDGTTYPTTNFIATLDQGQANEEKILVATRSGTAGTIATGGRGYNGTTAASHLAGASILHTIDGQDLDEANQVAHATLGAIAAKGDILTGSAVNALAKTTVGADGTVLTAHAAGAGGVEWAAIPDPIVAGQVIAQVLYAASADVTFDTSASTPLDATNLTIPLTVPPSGDICVEADICVQADTGALPELSYLNHSGGAAVSTPALVLFVATPSGAGVQVRAHYKMPVTGLTPGASMQLDLAGFNGGTSIAAALVSASGDPGPALLTVYAA